MAKKYYDATSVDYEAVEVFGCNGIFCEARIDRDSVPSELYFYEVRDDSSDGEPAEIAKSIAVDFFGTLLTKEPLEPLIGIPFYFSADGDDEDSWNYSGYQTTLQEFVNG